VEEADERRHRRSGRAEKVAAALAFAAKAHRNQVRKDTDTPYIAHPAAVAVMLARIGCEDDVVAVGVLHDVVEDTDVELADIEEKFGPRIAGLVSACSEPSKSRLSWEDRKRHTVKMLEAGVDRDIAMVMCADKLDNTRSMLVAWREVGDALWKRFNRGKESQRWYVRALAKAFDGYDGELFRQYRTIADELFPPEDRKTGGPTHP